MHEDVARKGGAEESQVGRGSEEHVLMVIEGFDNPFDFPPISVITDGMAVSKKKGFSYKRKIHRHTHTKPIKNEISLPHFLIH